VSNNLLHGAKKKLKIDLLEKGGNKEEAQGGVDKNADGKS
jgi:hypothetical protein